MDLYYNNGTASVFGIKRTQQILTSDINYTTTYAFNNESRRDLIVADPYSASQLVVFFKDNKTINVWQSFTSNSIWSKMRIISITGVKI